MVRKVLVVLAAAAMTAATSLGALAAESPSKDDIRWRGGFDCEARYDARDIVFYEGSSYMASEPVLECVKPGEAPWERVTAGGENGSAGRAGVAGADGAAGTFGGSFQSPDGKFKVSVTNTGISLTGPQTTVELTPNFVKVNGVTVSVQSGATTEVRSTGSTNVSGAQLSLGGGCASVGRQGDRVTGQFNFTWYPPGPSQQPWPDGPMTNGRVDVGSQLVRAC